MNMHRDPVRAGLPPASAERNETARSPASMIARFAPALLRERRRRARQLPGVRRSRSASGNSDSREKRPVLAPPARKPTERRADRDRAGGHRADADRNRLLHVAAAPPHQSHGIRKCQRAGSDQCRIFAEAVAGDKVRPKALCLQEPGTPQSKPSRIAGCVFSVSFRSSSGPLKQSRDSENPRARSASSKTSRASA